MHVCVCLLELLHKLMCGRVDVCVCMCVCQGQAAPYMCLIYASPAPYAHVIRDCVAYKLVFNLYALFVTGIRYANISVYMHRICTHIVCDLYYVNEHRN
jgi:hypothetical protein